MNIATLKVIDGGLDAAFLTRFVQMVKTRLAFFVSNTLAIQEEVAEAEVVQAVVNSQEA